MAIIKVDVSENKRLTKDEVYEAYERFCADKKLTRNQVRHLAGG